MNELSSCPRYWQFLIIWCRAEFSHQLILLRKYCLAIRTKRWHCNGLLYLTRKKYFPFILFSLRRKTCRIFRSKKRIYRGDIKQNHYHKRLCVGSGIFQGGSRPDPIPIRNRILTFGSYSTDKKEKNINNNWLSPVFIFLENGKNSEP